jgi:hypothetical protein
MDNAKAYSLASQAHLQFVLGQGYPTQLEMSAELDLVE